MVKRTRTTRRLEVWLKDTDLALFVLNSQRRLVFFNHGSERLTGWAATDLLGQKCDFVSEPDSNKPSALLAALSPPPEAWTGKPTDAPTNIPHREAAPSPRLISYFPLVDEEGKVNAMLGVVVRLPPPNISKSVPPVQRLHAELAALRQTVRRRYGDGSLIGRAPAMLRTFSQIKIAQSSLAAVHFVGESGTGKHHLARILHYQGPGGRRAFVPLDCRATARLELEQTLARLQIHADSDALRTGAVYFQHVDSAPTDVQLTLAEWLRTQPESSGVQILSGADRPLKPLVDLGQFSSELFYALTQLQIELPPLRERMEDLELLTQHFLEELNRDAPEQVGGLTDDVWRQFRRYNWPGNVEELRRVIVECRSNCSDPMIGHEHLPFRFRTGVTAQAIGPIQRSRKIPLDQLLEQVEREHIEQTLAECQNNKAKAADLLGITRPRLYRRMEILGIVDPEVSTNATNSASPEATNANAEP